MTLGELATWLNAEVSGGEAQIARVSALEDATADAIVFATDAETCSGAMQSGAGAVVAPLALRAEPSGTSSKPVLWVRDAKLAFARAAHRLSPMRAPAGIHPTATVAQPELVGEGVSIGPGCVIAAGVRIGPDCQILPRVTIYPGVTLGRNCIVQAGAVLGSTGFGYVRDPETGEYLLFPQQGALIIEDDVEIGANTTIDRGALGETRIGRGTKIDNLVHIAHNCRIGRNVMIAAQVGISGSCVIEDGAILAGQVGISDHCHIGPGVVLGGQAGVYRGKSVTGPGELFAGTPAEPIRDHMKSLARLRRLK